MPPSSAIATFAARPATWYTACTSHRIFCLKMFYTHLLIPLHPMQVQPRQLHLHCIIPSLVKASSYKNARVKRARHISCLNTGAQGCAHLCVPREFQHWGVGFWLGSCHDGCHEASQDTCSRACTEGEEFAQITLYAAGCVQMSCELGGSLIASGAFLDILITQKGLYPAAYLWTKARHCWLCGKIKHLK